MAEIRQGYLDDYTQNTSGNIGIGTSSASDAKLEIIGGTTSQELNITGIATFGSVSGFIKKHTNYTENVNINIGDSGTLSGEIVVGAGLTMTVGTAATASQGSVDSLKVSNMFQPPSGTTNQRPPGKTGALFYNFDSKTIEFFDGSSWRQVDNTTRSSRAVIARGYTPSSPNGGTAMDHVNISSLGDSISFGDLTVGRYFMNANSSSTRGIFGGGDPGPSNSDVIDYITIASEGNAIDFGNLLASGRCFGGASSSTRGLHFSEGSQPGGTNVISYSEIATLGNALDFGDLIDQNGNKGTATSSPTRYIFHTQNNSNATIYFGSIASKGNSTRFGNYISGGPSHAAAALLRCCSNQTRAVFGGGYFLESPYGFVTSKMGSITIASEGNAIEFGDLTIARYGAEATSNQVRGIFAGGQGGNPYPWIDTIDFITFASSGNAQDFGDINASVGGALSDSHGGLGGF